MRQSLVPSLANQLAISPDDLRSTHTSLQNAFDYDVPNKFWKQAHAVNALAIVGVALLLSAEKIYLITRRTPKTKTN